MDTNERDQWLAPKEIARELHLHVSSIYRAIERGELPALRLSDGGAIRIHRSALNPNESNGIRD